MALISAQRDFSSGELNADAARRDDQALQRSGVRQIRNFRVLNSGAATNRPGRRAVFPSGSRADKVQVSADTTFYLSFGPGFINIYDSDGVLASSDSNPAAYAWTNDTVRNIVLTVVPKSAGVREVVICHPDIPKIRIATWTEGDSPEWTFGNFAFGSMGDGGLQVPFYRLAQAGVTITPSSFNGNITVQASDNVWPDAAIVGTIIRFYERQMLVTQWNSPSNVSATVVQYLYPSAVYESTGSGYGFNGTFALGDIVENEGDATKGEIVTIFTTLGVVTSVKVNHFGGNVFDYWEVDDIIAAPSGRFKISVATPDAANPGASTQWDEAVFSDFRGWPASCFFDQNRLGFCNIPSLPSGIAWSRTLGFRDFMVGATTATDPIFEIVPEQARVLHVATKTDELVLTNKGIWFVPISETNPLRPGSVAFKKVSVDACADIPPAQMNEGVIFINSGRNRIVTIVPTGTLTNPWQTRESSLFHQHLFSAPFAIAATTGDDDFAERYVYVLNGNGTIVVGKYDVGKEWVGWQPWDCEGTPLWVSVLGDETLFVTQYGSSSIAERLDNDCYLDGAILVNSPPDGLEAPPGQGAFWWLPNGTVDLMDGRKPMGTYNIDSLGSIIPIEPGEDLSSATLMGGQAWENVLEPFLPNADTGADQLQRTRRRKVILAAVTVQEWSGGFRIARLYSGPTGANLPALGTEMGSHTAATWNQGDNQADAPPLRSTTVRWRPMGRSFDPRIALIKSVPGPITIVEFLMEATT